MTAQNGSNSGIDPSTIREVIADLAEKFGCTVWCVGAFSVVDVGGLALAKTQRVWPTRAAAKEAATRIFSDAHDQQWGDGPIVMPAIWANLDWTEEAPVMSEDILDRVRPELEKELARIRVRLAEMEAAYSV